MEVMALESQMFQGVKNPLQTIITTMLNVSCFNNLNLLFSKQQLCYFQAPNAKQSTEESGASNNPPTSQGSNPAIQGYIIQNPFKSKGIFFKMILILDN